MKKYVFQDKLSVILSDINLQIKKKFNFILGVNKGSTSVDCLPFDRMPEDRFRLWIVYDFGSIRYHGIKFMANQGLNLILVIWVSYFPIFKSWLNLKNSNHTLTTQGKKKFKFLPHTRAEIVETTFLFPKFRTVQGRFRFFYFRFFFSLPYISRNENILFLKKLFLFGYLQYKSCFFLFPGIS